MLSQKSISLPFLGVFLFEFLVPHSTPHVVVQRLLDHPPHLRTINVWQLKNCLLTINEWVEESQRRKKAFRAFLSFSFPVINMAIWIEGEGLSGGQRNGNRMIDEFWDKVSLSYFLMFTARWRKRHTMTITHQKSLEGEFNFSQAISFPVLIEILASSASFSFWYEFWWHASD